MKNTKEAVSTDRKIRSVASVLISYIALIFVQSAVSGILAFFNVQNIIPDAICDLLAYLAGIILSALVYKYAAGFTNEGQSEMIHVEVESGAEILQSKASTTHTRYIFYTSGALNLMLFFNIFFAYFSDGRVSSAHDSLLFSAAVGILIKSSIEEALFRKAYLKNLTGTLGSLPSVLTVSVMFGVWHPSGSRIFAFISSIILGALYLGIREITNDERSDRAFICTSICHASFNAVMYTAEAVYIHLDFSVFGTVCTGAFLSALIFSSTAVMLIIKKRRQAMR